MHNVNLKRIELLDIVRSNLEKHVSQYEEAIEDYKNAVRKISENNLEIARTGDLETFKKIEFYPAKPKYRDWETDRKSVV